MNNLNIVIHPISCIDDGVDAAAYTKALVQEFSEFSVDVTQAGVRNDGRFKKGYITFGGSVADVDTTAKRITGVYEHCKGTYGIEKDQAAR